MKTHILPITLRKPLYDALIDEQHRRYIATGERVSLAEIIREVIEKTYVVSGKWFSDRVWKVDSKTT